MYKTTVTTKGARKGHAKSDDGLLDVALSVPKSMGATAVIILTQSNCLEQDIPLVLEELYN